MRKVREIKNHFLRSKCRLHRVLTPKLYRIKSYYQHRIEHLQEDIVMILPLPFSASIFEMYNTIIISRLFQELRVRICSDHKQNCKLQWTLHYTWFSPLFKKREYWPSKSISLIRLYLLQEPWNELFLWMDRSHTIPNFISILASFYAIHAQFVNLTIFVSIKKEVFSDHSKLHYLTWSLI